MGRGYVVLVLGATWLCEGFDSNQQYATFTKTLHEHRRWYIYIYVQLAFVLTLTAQFNIWTFSKLKELFAFMWLGIWDNLHTPNARWLAYCDLHTFSHENLWRCSTIESLSSSGPHEPSTLCCRWIWLAKGLFHKIKHGHLCASLPSIVIILESRGLSMSILFPCHSSSLMFQDPTQKFHFHLRTCSWKFHDPHQVKCTQNNPFMGLGSCNCQPLKCTLGWRKHNDISLWEPKHTKLHHVAHKP